MRRFTILLVLVLVPLALASQDSQRTPQIRVAARLVEVGVIVRDKNGPVAGLTKEDFTVLDRGKPQKISIFSADAAASAQQPPQQPLPQNTFSDLPQYGATAPRSVTVVLLDNLNTLYGSVAQSKYEHSPYWLEDLALRNAKNHLIEFTQQLQPQDRVAIYGLQHSLHVLCDFTSDRDQLLTILRNYDTRSLTNREVVEPGNTMIIMPGHDNPMADILGQAGEFENGASGSLAGAANADRGAQTMAALQAIAAHVANIPGRKNLVWLTANLPFSGAAMAHVLSPANIAVYPVDARGLLARSPMVLADIPGTADADDVSGASGHMDNMPAQSSQPIGITTMQKLADETGGQAFVNTNDITGAIRKAVEDSAVTYSLGFYINRDALDGKFHEIKIEVRGKGLTIRYPKGYFAFPDTEATKDEDQFRLVAAVQSPLESSSIPLTATVERVDQPPHSLKVLCTIDAHNLRLVQSGGLRKGSVEVYIVEQDQTGKVILQSGKTFTLQFPEKQYEALLKSGILFHEFVPPHAGATTLRVLVEDPSTTELGSVIIPLAQVN
ncbi:MAG TPA: VWA domain-containing protein [Candidatus Angelobacter sp.]|nr:VWA domain-containing protein [Candidatus Angelobacter sp.]